jgi:hypothetical protein
VVSLCANIINEAITITFSSFASVLSQTNRRLRTREAILVHKRR